MPSHPASIRVPDAGDIRTPPPGAPVLFVGAETDLLNTFADQFGSQSFRFGPTILPRVVVPRTRSNAGPPIFASHGGGLPSTPPISFGGELEPATIEPSTDDPPPIVAPPSIS